MISVPQISRSHPDRDVHAEEAIEASFDTLAVKAELMGWTCDETAFALSNRVAHHRSQPLNQGCYRASDSTG